MTIKWSIHFCGVFIEPQNAFDTVNHDILLENHEC